MARGGKRPGAGRKPGKATAATKIRQEALKAVSDLELSPLRVMLTTMKALWTEAQGADGTLNMGLAMKAAAIAKDAAPFVHPKLANVDMTANGTVNVREVTFVMDKEGNVVREVDGNPRLAGGNSP
jgi:hypothetical protein